MVNKGCLVAVVIFIEDAKDYYSSLMRMPKITTTTKQPLFTSHLKLQGNYSVMSSKRF